MTKSKSPKLSLFVVTAIYTALFSARRCRCSQVFVTEGSDRSDAEMRVRDQIVPKRQGVVFETCEALPIDLSSGTPLEVYGGTLGTFLT